MAGSTGFLIERCKKESLFVRFLESKSHTVYVECRGKAHRGGKAIGIGGKATTSTQQPPRYCVSCGRAIDWNANICQYCGHDYRQQQIGLSQMTQPPKTKNRTDLIIVVVVVVTIAILAGIAAVISMTPSHKADLRAILSYAASNDDLGLGTGGTVEVYGNIYNYGDADGGGTVYLHIYDGYSWHDYGQATGVVRTGGSVLFDWSVHFETMDHNNVQVQYSVSVV